MNTKIVAVLSTAAGFACGYFYCKHQNDRTFDERVAEEVEQMRAHDRKKKDKLAKDISRTDEVTDDELTGKAVPISSLRGPDMNEYEKTRTRYHDMSKKEDNILKQKGDLELVNIDVFAEDNYRYDAVTYFYYKQDDIMTEEDDSVCDMRTVLKESDEAIRTVKETEVPVGAGNDSEAVYFFDHELELRYEVIVLNRAYAVEILGATEVPMTPSEAHKAKKG